MTYKFTLSNIGDNPGATRPRKRKGRGPASGTGKTAGRGHKGQKSRSGHSQHGTEGGQTPLYKRLPKRGMRGGVVKKLPISTISLSKIVEAIERGWISSDQLIDRDFLVENEWVKPDREIKLLGCRPSENFESKIGAVIDVDFVTLGALSQLEMLGGRVWPFKNRKPRFRLKDVLPIKFADRSLGNFTFCASVDVAKISFNFDLKWALNSNFPPLNGKIKCFEVHDLFPPFEVGLKDVEASNGCWKKEVKIDTIDQEIMILYSIFKSGREVMNGQLRQV